MDLTLTLLLVGACLPNAKAAPLPSAEGWWILLLLALLFCCDCVA